MGVGVKWLSAANILSRALGEGGIVREGITVGEEKFKMSWLPVPRMPTLVWALALMAGDASANLGSSSREICEIIFND